MYKALYLSPMIPSFDIKATALFFKEVLAFQPMMDDAVYHILRKEHLTVHLLPAGTDIGQMECYLEIDDVDNLWLDIQDKLAGIKHRAPFNQEYGMREIHLEIPHTKALLFIGQVINNP